jgi:peptidoglycan/xylan/chitin deacetylase (PgdA/CDA1 family)
MRYRIGLSFLIAVALFVALRPTDSRAAQGISSSPTLPASFVPPPILMYHRVDVDTPADHVSRDLTVTPVQFRAQLVYLKAHGIAAISMAQFEERLQRGLVLDRAVVLTFDDGYGDQYRYAVPLLSEFGDTATFYVITDQLNRARHLTWAQLQTMSRERMDIAAHGIRHDDLSQMDAAQQTYQIDTSVRALRAFLHVPIESYAYPSGRFNRETLDIVRKTGVPLAVTTDPTFLLWPENRFEMTRVRVRGRWTISDFAQALRSALASRHVVLR